MIAESDKLQDTELLRCATELERDGVTILPPLVSESQLSAMQRAFAVKLRNLRWNNFDGYQKTEPYRLMVEDVLLLDQGFVDIAIHPTVKAVLSKYLGTKYELTEAKGWKSLPTKRDFHGWHGDAWYDQKGLREIPREVKLAFYLTDVRSGGFNYIKGSHRKQHPRPVRNDELLDVDSSQIAEFYGPAGTAFVFDTSGIHRQGVPMLEPRQAVFYNYHDPNITLQQEDITYYRYHPLLLNAAFLGGMSDDDRRVLGFGNKTNFIPAFERSTKPTSLYTLFRTTHEAQVHIRHFAERLGARWRRTFHK